MKREIVRAIWLTGVLAIAGLALFVYRTDSRTVDAYRPAQAVGLESDGESSGQYAYQYRVGDRLCRGVSLAPVDPGAALTVYYEKQDVCSSQTDDPAAVRIADQVVFFLIAFYLAFFAVMIPNSLPAAPEEMTWQRS